ncbi:hypothetical protein DSECCO2_656010 [anaerobic digester metagenome]
MEKFFTKKFEEFIQCFNASDWREIYDFYLASVDREDVTFFDVYQANGSEDTIIEHKASPYCLRLSPAQAEFLPKWIEKNLMDDMDSDSYFGLHYQLEKED